jgi:hypothetical protein
MLVSPHNPKKIFIAAERRFISRDRGDTWDRTEDLSGKPDRTKLPIMGAPVDPRKHLSAHDGQDTFGQIVSLSESPVKEGLLYVGTDDGNLQVSQDDGKTWKNVVANVPGVPKGTYVRRLVASKHVEGRCYAAFDGHRSGDFKPYIYVTEDKGETWRPIVSGIPDGHSLHVVREHHRNQNLLFAGTERGLYVSFDRGGKWSRMGKPLPSVPVDDIQIHRRENDLILGTHGRSIWILDDITPLEQIAEAAEKDAFLFQPRGVVSWRIASNRGFMGNKPFSGTNPSQGASIQYWLKKAPADGEPFSVTIMDKSGRSVVNSLSFASKNAGLNKINWNLRVGTSSAPQTTAPTPPGGSGGGGGQGGGGGRRFGGGGITGPRVLPGTYTVRLVAGKEEITRQIVVDEDPRLRITAADRKAHFEAIMRLNALYTLDRDARSSLDKTKSSLDALQSSEEFKTASEELKKRVEEASKRVKLVQEKFGGGQQLAGGPGGRGGFGGGRGGRGGGGRPGAGGEGGVAPTTPGAGGGEGTPTPQGPGTPGVAQGEGSPGPGPRAGGGVNASLQGRITSLVFLLDPITEAPSSGIKSETDKVERDLKAALKEVNEISSRLVPELNRELEKSKLKTITGGAAVASIARPETLFWAVTEVAQQLDEEEEEVRGEED